MNSLAILIPNYNGASLIRETVSRFNSGCPGVKIIVVDDASTDNSITELSGSKATVIIRETNGGFAAAVNTGLRYLTREDYKYVLISNSDVEVDNAKCAEILGAISKYLTKPDMAVLGFQEDSNNIKDIRIDINISGFLFALRLDAVKIIGLMDETFFMYGEEQDYFRRIRKAGLKIHQTGIVVKHIGEGSGASKYRNSLLAIRNAIYLEVKSNSFIGFMKTIIALFLLINRLYTPRGREDHSLKRVLRPGILIGNMFLFYAIIWNIVKLIMRYFNDK
jgi:GT2 family glycosyltransferase